MVKRGFLWFASVVKRAPYADLGKRSSVPWDPDTSLSDERSGIHGNFF